MLICSKCLGIVEELPTYVIDKVGRASPIHSSYILCCDYPDPIEVEFGEMTDYEENWESLDLDDLTEKEKIILNYLTKEGRIAYVDTEILKGQSTDTVVHDQQLWFDLL